MLSPHYYKNYFFTRNHQFLFFLLCCNCYSEPNRYNLKQDTAPLLKINAARVPNAIPRKEALSRYGNPPHYKVLGKRYSVLKTATDYREKGIASWYGMKFHTYLTSNREVYDMFKMTAAHRTLPIPTYVRVTNLNNQRSIIVRVNDRGPFVAGRIIDLSYVAAHKLDMLKTGTAPVEVKAITSKKLFMVSRLLTPYDSSKLPKIVTQKIWLQVGSFRIRKNAEYNAQKIARLTGKTVKIQSVKQSYFVLYRVVIGPFENLVQTKPVRVKLQNQGFEHILIKYSK